jgi:hypothetical protein
MNRFLSLLLLCLVTFSGTLTAQHRRTPDACPGVNNKKPTGQYASLSKRSGQNSSFSSPRYQYLYAKSRYPVTASAEKPGGSKRNTEGTKGETIVPGEAPAEKNTSSKAVRDEKNTKNESSAPAMERQRSGDDEFPGQASPGKGTEAGVSNATPANNQTAPAEIATPPARNDASEESENVSKPSRKEKTDGPEATGKTSPSTETQESKNPYTRNLVKNSEAPKQNNKQKKTVRKKHTGRRRSDACPEF